jgi:hypothetical protein
LPARAERKRRRVNSRQRARYPRTLRRGFMGSKENVSHRSVRKGSGGELTRPRVLLRWCLILFVVFLKE